VYRHNVNVHQRIISVTIDCAILDCIIDCYLCCSHSTD